MRVNPVNRAREVQSSNLPIRNKEQLHAERFDEIIMEGWAFQLSALVPDALSQAPL